MTRFHQDGIVRIQAERSAQSGIFLWLKDCDGKEHIVSLECEPEMYGVRDALVDAINAVQPVKVVDPPRYVPGSTGPWPRPSSHRQAVGMRCEHVLPDDAERRAAHRRMNDGR